jgi:hypothetical protein
LHTPNERQRILAGVCGDSSLLWSVSQVAGFGVPAASLAESHHDLYGGLILATNGTTEQLERWLKITALSACELPAAASAALVLQPNANPRDRQCWLSTLKNSKDVRHPYEAVLWAAHTLPPKKWSRMKNELRDCVLVDRGQWFAHWYIHVEPQQAPGALGCDGMEELWGCEIIDTLGDLVDDWAFRFKLGEKLDLTAASPASLALAWLNQRQKNGTAS